jgi:hypothetical protein
MSATVESYFCLQSYFGDATDLQASATHAYWAHHPDELWRRFLTETQRCVPDQFEKICQILKTTWHSAAVTAEQDVQFELSLSHDCCAISCTDQTCVLCCNSVLRRCTDLLSAKYLVKDPITPACGAQTRVSLRRVDAPGRPLKERDFQSLQPYILQV